MNHGRWCFLFVSALLSLSIARADYISHPAIDLEQLEQIGIAGLYDGISLYTDTRQLTHLPPSSASVLSYANNTFQLNAASELNGSIWSACELNNKLYIGGTFHQFANTNVSNIAAIDLTTGALSPLGNGLDGSVYHVMCDPDTKSVYVGGDFIAPLATAPAYAESLARFGGGVAVWKTDTGAWQGAPWKGVNGPIYAASRLNKTVFFGGLFDTTADGQTSYAPASQPVSLNSPAVSLLAKLFF